MPKKFNPGTIGRDASDHILQYNSWKEVSPKVQDLRQQET